MRWFSVLLVAAGLLQPGWASPLKELRRVSHTVKQHLPESRAATVAIRSISGLGSGVIISPEGLVLTAGHISAEPDRPIVAVLADGTQVRGRTLGLSWLVDSGMIRLEERDAPYPFVEIAPPGSYADREWCYALGHPDGLQEDRGDVLRIGRILSSTPYAVRSDCRLLGGDSGGPLFDLEGRVIGIHSRIGFKGDENFHAPMDAFHNDWDLLLSGEVKRFWPREERGFLGVQTVEAPNGVRINGVVDGSAAAEASLQVGDVITRVGNQTIRDGRGFRLTVGSHQPGDQVGLAILRGEDTLQVEVTLQGWPDPSAMRIEEQPGLSEEEVPSP